MRASRGMGCMASKKLKKLKEGGTVKDYELSKVDKERKAQSESGSPFNSKSMVPTERMKKGGTVKDACYKKVKASYKVFPSAYASGAIAKCRKNKGK